MPHRFGAPMVERARVLVETSPRTLEDIAVLLGASVPTLRNWIMKYGWRRHPGAPRATRKLPPQKEGPARRVYEGRAGVGDLAVLLGCHESYVHRLAKQRGWQRAGTPGKPRLRPPNPALLASADEMGDPRLTSPARILLLERAPGLPLIEAIERPEPGPDHRAELLANTLKLLRPLRDGAPPPGGRAPPALPGRGGARTAGDHGEHRPPPRKDGRAAGRSGLRDRGLSGPQTPASGVLAPGTRLR